MMYFCWTWDLHRCILLWYFCLSTLVNVQWCICVEIRTSSYQFCGGIWASHFNHSIISFSFNLGPLQSNLVACLCLVASFNELHVHFHFNKGSLQVNFAACLFLVVLVIDGDPIWVHCSFSIRLQCSNLILWLELEV